MGEEARLDEEKKEGRSSQREKEGWAAQGTKGELPPFDDDIC